MSLTAGAGLSPAPAIPDPAPAVSVSYFISFLPTNPLYSTEEFILW
jgi:hypothetical protein